LRRSSLGLLQTSTPFELLPKEVVAIPATTYLQKQILTHRPTTQDVMCELFFVVVLNCNTLMAAPI
jgi:hypothetical protein